jgi:single-strand DNA-binding protein
MRRDAAMDNVVVGHLCQDPILRQARRGGRPVARFTVAVNVWRRVGEAYEQRPPVFHRVVCFGPMAENVSNSLRKGMEVLAVGEWVDDSYSDEQGQRRVQTAMEARAVGPALRRATALVHKVDHSTRAAVLEAPAHPAPHQPDADNAAEGSAEPTDGSTPDGSAPGDLTRVEAFAAGIAEPAGRRRGGMHRRRDQTPEPVPARGG